MLYGKKKKFIIIIWLPRGLWHWLLQLVKVIFFSFQQHITSPSLLSITNIKFEFLFNSFPIFHLLSLSFSFSLIFTFSFLSLISPVLYPSQTITSSFHFFLFLQASVKVLSARWVSRPKSKKSYFDYHFGCKQRFYYYLFHFFAWNKINFKQIMILYFIKLFNLISSLVLYIYSMPNILVIVYFIRHKIS